MSKKGVPSPFKGKKHSEQSKTNMSFGKTGILRNAEERAERRREYKDEWRKLNPDKIAGYDLKSLKPRAVASSMRRRKVRMDGIEKLGGRCVSPTCCWVNSDGTRGCTDTRILQFDHVNGGGTQERNKMASYETLCKEVLSDIAGKFQLLCANCNWIKAFEKREFRYRYEMEAKS